MIKKISLVLLCLLLTVSCIRQPQRPDTGEMLRNQSSINGTNTVRTVRAAVDNCEIRSGTGTESNVMQTVNKGTLLNTVGKSDNWYIVRLDNNQIGIVSENDVEPVVDDFKDTQIQGAVRLTAEEQQMVTLVNQERAKANLPPLTVDMEVARVARMKAKDMVDHNYFSHNSPTYGNPFDMLNNLGIKYLHAGENLAGNPSIEDAHQALMNSEDHRKNILNTNYTHIGVGAQASKSYGNIIVEFFISKPK
ncbi:CAP domain-containing protein [Proteiniborus sp. MB09-C3]|uniref:CAP domain-containing protein n=1 Tax=Proteiniborus sp. MB09-C3 TaxID=3050072 RepID=UPI002557673F|nr:CAP domain-containing protein [Proteiniborus sp. MB09-C3]WIV11725.1 CAP domain-containing protein [Proteiniborus sp. MB09-C3]